VPHPANPQSFNRYSYCLNNPLKYVDPSGHQSEYLILYNYVMEHGTEGPLPANIVDIIIQGTSGGMPGSSDAIIITPNYDVFDQVTFTESVFIGDDTVLIGETKGGNVYLNVGETTIDVHPKTYEYMLMYGWTLDDIVQVEKHFRTQPNNRGMLVITGLGTVPPLGEDSALTVHNMNGGKVLVNPQGRSAFYFLEYRTTKGKTATYCYLYISQTIINTLYSFNIKYNILP